MFKKNSTFGQSHLGSFSSHYDMERTNKNAW